MSIMNPGNMEETSTENAKISDSGYSNTCSNSQSNTSSGSSVSRNSNRSASSGYHGGNLSIFESSTEALPKPIAKRKDKAHKKKKFKGALAAFGLHGAEVSQNATTVGLAPAPLTNVHATLVAEPCKPIADKTTEEVAVVELVDTTDPGVHNDNNLASSTEAGLASKASPIDETSLQSTEEYYAVISMHDGLVMHATPALHEALDYPKDSWTGKLFIDFLHPKDKHILTERIASEIAISRDFCPSGANGRKASIFCRMRRFNAPQCAGVGGNHHGTNGGQYVPYRINLLVQNFHRDKTSVFQKQIMQLVASFQPVRSAYKEPEETIISTVFTTCHAATCRLSYVDPDVVQYLGYLPQDMIDRSLFDFYHPEDLPLIKDIYEIVINLESSSFVSKPYRFLVQNGGFVVLETEWSSFINPWTKSLEFVIGQHRVLKGPADPDIFRPAGDLMNDLLLNISEEVFKEAKIIQKEIKALLDEKHDSVMLGEISPHHKYYDSKSSTETPPSYNQLNYHDNIERFFSSNIGVTANNRPYGSDEENLNSSANNSDEPGKNNTSSPELKCTSSTNGSGNSGSAENLSSESNNQQSFGSRDETSNTTSNNSTANGQGETSNATSSNSATNGRVKPPILTESLLNRHNEDMEKLLVQKHRELKKGDKRKSSLNDQKVKADKPAGRCEAGIAKTGTKLKRSGSQGWEGDHNFKISKYDDTLKAPENYQIPAATNAKFKPTSMDTSPNVTKTNTNVHTNLWPAQSTVMPSSATITHQCFTIPNACSQAISPFPTFPQMFPVYYMPVPRENPPLAAVAQEHPGPPNHISQPTPYCFVPVPFMTTAMLGAMYPSMIDAPAPAAILYRSFIVPEQVAAAAPPQSSAPAAYPAATAAPAAPTTMTTTTAATVGSLNSKRPVSRATSVKAEPGSTMAMSESSKKICSPCGIVSSCLSNEGGCFSVVDEYTTITTQDHCTTEDKDNGSRNSSDFSSCLNKSSDDSSNTDQQPTASSFKLYHKNKGSRANHKRKASGMVLKEPPWIEGVNITPELVYRYQVGPKPLNEVLKADLDFLRHSKQSSLVNDQLGQLFLDLDLEGLGTKFILEEAGTNSVSDSSSDGSQRYKSNRSFT